MFLISANKRFHSFIIIIIVTLCIFSIKLNQPINSVQLYNTMIDINSNNCIISRVFLSVCRLSRCWRLSLPCSPLYGCPTDRTSFTIRSPVNVSKTVGSCCSVVWQSTPTAPSIRYCTTPCPAGSAQHSATNCPAVSDAAVCLMLSSCIV